MSHYILPAGHPSTVIKVDNRDPAVSWQNHLNRTYGRRGGVDVVAPIGTPVYAPMNCYVHRRPNNGTAGNSMNLEDADGSGWSDIMSHLSRYAVADGAYVKQGGLVGYTGNTGGVAAHLHWHREDPQGARRNPWNYFGTGADVEAHSADWAGWQDLLKGYGYGGSVDGVPGKNTYLALQKFLAEKFEYHGDVDGVPGSLTWAAFTRATVAGYPNPAVEVPAPAGINWAKWQEILASYGYSGPIDGDPGKNTYSALQKYLAEKFEYTGPIDGIPGSKTWEAYMRAEAALSAVITGAPAGVDWAKWQDMLQEYGYSGPLDGDPGANTYVALQKFLAEKAGYKGAVDGIPGVVTWAAMVVALAAGHPKTTEAASDGELTPIVIVPKTTGSFGIDVATSQREINFATAKAEGVEFVIVKMGGLNALPQYVAPYYKVQVEGVQAAGLRLGHYYLIGAGQTPEQQADFFVDNLHKFNVNRDVLALDNERLDSNKNFWKDVDTARFIAQVILRTGIPASRIWLYSGANDFRTHKPWTASEALGVRFWWAAYGSGPLGHTPDHEPSLQGSLTKWDVHQFSSGSAVAGYKLDGNYSTLSVDELFAKGTPADVPEVEVPVVVVVEDTPVNTDTDEVTAPDTIPAGSRMWIIAVLTGIVATLTAIITTITNLVP